MICGEDILQNKHDHLQLCYSIQKNEILNITLNDVDFPRHVVLLNDFLGDVQVWYQRQWL